MMPITFTPFGYTGANGQLNRIIPALEGLGLIQAPQNADFIYSNDSGGYDAAIAAKLANPRAKLILNVLDICEHCLPNFDLGKLETQLRQADAITVISPYVQSQLMRYFSLASTVIWNPIKDVNSFTRVKARHGRASTPYPQFKAMMVGRLRDIGKRGSLGIQALILAGFNETEVAMVGSEYPGWGTNMGVVSDEVLNDLYNSVDYVIVPSLFEGLCLPLAEALVCGALPILCSDLTTLPDFTLLGLPNHWTCYPTPHSMAHWLRRLRNDPALLETERAKTWGIGDRIETVMSAKAVAQRIAAIYGKLMEADA